MRKDWTPPADVDRNKMTETVRLAIEAFNGTGFYVGNKDWKPKEESMQYGMKYKPGQDLTGKYILWCPTSPEVPSYVFPDRPAAIKASVAMANRFHGQEFAVCKIVGTTKPAGVRFDGEKY